MTEVKADGFRVTIVCMDCASTNVGLTYDSNDVTFVECNNCGQKAELT